jgi:N6-adenosine-specific RNA methylase IME4
MRSDPVLPALSKARAALAVAYANKDAVTAKEIRDQAEAVKVYASRRDSAGELAQQAGEIKVRAEWTLGRILRDMRAAGERVGHGGDRRSKSSTTTSKLSDLGITRDLSSKAQRVATLPEADLDAKIAETNARGETITTAEVVRDVRKRQGKTNRADNIARIERGNTDLSTGRLFSVILADPPWRYEHVRTESRAIENQYPTMTLDEICALPVRQVSSGDAILFLWATSPKLAESMVVIEAWGFTYRTCMVWVKDKIGMGYYARQQHELLLIGTCGKLPSPDEANRPSSVINAPRDRHSAKPTVVHTIIERMYPTLGKLEMFARTERAGWDRWGNQS